MWIIKHEGHKGLEGKSKEMYFNRRALCVLGG